MIFPTTSKKPVLLVGNGARLAGAAELITGFSKKTKIPVLTTMNAVDLTCENEDFGFIGTYGNRVANMILSECDVLISVGARLSLRQIGHKVEKFAPKAKLIRAEVDPYELSRDIKKDEEKHQVDAKDFMEILLQETIPPYLTWREQCEEARTLLQEQDQEIGNITAQKIASLLPHNAFVAVDVGQNQCWCAQSLALKGEHSRILICGGYGGMGCSLPMAIGACISMENKAVYCITGDGGLQMNIQELETVKRENLPIKILVMNNQVLGKISEVQSGSYGGRFAQTTKESGYSVPDFCEIARAYGIRAASVDSYQQLDECEEWLTDDASCLIDIKIPEDSLLIPKIEWESGEIFPKIDESLYAKVQAILCQ